jgi:probable F420-dependent oxidoreductase
VKFVTQVPGLIHWPPEDFAPGRDNWQRSMRPEDFQRVAHTADELGFDALSVSEHLLVPVGVHQRMGGHYPQALTAMAFLAGATTRIKVTSMVMVLPAHHPVDLAKAIATLDVMSGGRLIVNFGVGMAPAELAAVGVPYERRGRVSDEYVRAMKELWSADRPSFSGEWVSFDDVVFEPKPVQQPHPPLWFGGLSLAALRRATRLGDGWAPSGSALGKGPWLEDEAQLPSLLARVREEREAAGIDRPFDVHLSVVRPRLAPDHTNLPPTFVPESAEHLIDELGRLADLGVTWTMAARPGPPPTSLDAHLDDLRWLAEEVVPHCRGIVPSA